MHQQGAVKDKAQMDATFIDGTGQFIRVLLAIATIKGGKTHLFLLEGEELECFTTESCSKANSKPFV